MPFLYDVWNVKLQLYAKGLVWSRGGKHPSKTFSIFYMLNSKKVVFNPYFSIGTCPMRKRLLWISRGLNLLSFSSKKYHFLWIFSLVIFMGNPSLRLSEVLALPMIAFFLLHICVFIFSVEWDQGLWYFRFIFTIFSNDVRYIIRVWMGGLVFTIH